ncbi:hypothetical protein N7510_009335 [Penicillium lagena]|uniref:uncharacterized protein n=1 Tax=Penicillium lagena TaxID=94218 RepID=UPI0025414820|nr:uncharacterized protein N7510_009335 [Penicillium lagena]KAJ5606554.1 hypothetical protein N7510_009335 [Penicillium lagena]
MAAVSVLSRGSSSLDILSKRLRPSIDIHLEGQTPGLVNSYTTGNHIEGTVTLSADVDTRFDEVEIILQGSSQTSVERTSSPGRAGAQQVFLRLRQPIDETEYPTPRVLEKGRTYQFPFTFVVPDRLLPQVCKHPKNNAHLERAHTMLPPTLGDPMLASNGKTLLDDMAPDMSRIAYMVRVAVLRKSTGEDQTTKSLAGFAKKVRIIPTVEEEPPISVTETSGYCTRKEKKVRRGLLRGRQGRLTVSSAQPKPLQLSPSCEVNDIGSTMATVQLRFDPVGNEQPPRLGSLTSKLRVYTFYSAEPWQDLVAPAGLVPFSQMSRGLYMENVPLSTMCVASAQWTKHSDSSRRDSMQSTVSEESTADGEIYYTASVLVPVSLPKKKAFIPTFQSCLLARIYSLDLSLSYHPAGKTVLTPTVSLRLPIQITNQPKFSESLKSELSVTVTQAEMDEFFRPRIVTLPNADAVAEVDPTRSETQSLAPPEYSETYSIPTVAETTS